MTKVLVTGATGFIGKNIIPKLRSCQYDIIATNSLDGDVADKATWLRFPRADILVHLAGTTFVPDSWNEPARFLKTNIHGTVCALDYCRQHRARLVYLSSYLYGNSEILPIPESAPIIANSPYALSKKIAEEVCKYYAESFGVSIIILRPFNVYGPGQSRQFLIPSIINQMRASNTIFVKDLEPRRDYVFIDDLVDAVIKAVDSQLEFEIFNIGTGVSYSVADLIDILQNMEGTNLHVRANGERRHGEIMDTQADITKAKNILAWTPKYSLRAGLVNMLSSGA